MYDSQVLMSRSFTTLFTFKLALRTLCLLINKKWATSWHFDAGAESNNKVETYLQATIHDITG